MVSEYKNEVVTGKGCRCGWAGSGWSVKGLSGSSAGISGASRNKPISPPRYIRSHMRSTNTEGNGSKPFLTNIMDHCWLRIEDIEIVCRCSQRFVAIEEYFDHWLYSSIKREKLRVVHVYKIADCRTYL